MIVLPAKVVAISVKKTVSSLITDALRTDEDIVMEGNYRQKTRISDKW